MHLMVDHAGIQDGPPKRTYLMCVSSVVQYYTIQWLVGWTVSLASLGWMDRSMDRRRNQSNRDWYSVMEQNPLGRRVIRQQRQHGVNGTSVSVALLLVVVRL